MSPQRPGSPEPRPAPEPQPGPAPAPELGRGPGPDAPAAEDESDPDGLLTPTPPSTARPVSRWWGITGGVVAAVAVLLFSVSEIRSSGQGVTATTIAYDVVDDTQVKVSFDVTRPPAQPVTCTVTATDGHFTVVGSATVVIPTGGAATTHHDAVVRTATRAVTGNVTDCVRT